MKVCVFAESIGVSVETENSYEGEDSMFNFLESNIPGYEEKVETDKLLTSLDDVVDVFADHLQDYLNDLLANICDRLGEEAKGVFSQKEIEQEIYSNTLASLEEVESDLYVVCRQQGDDSDEVLSSNKIPVLSFLYEQLEYGMLDSGWITPKVSQIVESRLFEFVKQSEWHIGIRSQDGEILENIDDWGRCEHVKDRLWRCQGTDYSPIVWYGPVNEKPIPEWTISTSTEEYDSNFWFQSSLSWQSCDVLEHLIKDYDLVLDIWYLAECGCWTPDMKDIIQKCPVEFEENDTLESFLCKADHIILQRIENVS